jgi:hypothetical protein
VEINLLHYGFSSFSALFQVDSAEGRPLRIWQKVIEFGDGKRGIRLWMGCKNRIVI